MKLEMLFSLPVVIGSLGNFSFLCHSMFLHFSERRSRSMDSMLRHLTVANLLFLLFRGIPEIMAATGMEDFLNNVGCKLVFYVLMIGKGVSFSITCLLSMVQVITLSPRSSRWAEVKVKTLKYIRSCTIFLWFLHMLLNFRVLMLMNDKWRSRNMTNIIDYQYCSAKISSKDQNSVFTALSLSHDILCLKLMIWSSGSMVLILYRHKQQMQHIHRHTVSSKSSTETRASQSIIFLVCAFISSYALSSITYVWFTVYDKTAWWLIKTSFLSGACFPTVSPFILMTREQCVWKPLWKK